MVLTKAAWQDRGPNGARGDSSAGGAGAGGRSGVLRLSGIQRVPELATVLSFCQTQDIPTEFYADKGSKAHLT